MTVETQTEDPEIRKANIRHNNFLANATMMQRQCTAIISSTTATEESKVLARNIQGLAEQLAESLETRISLPLPDS
jgi:hypothetical protein